MPSKRSELYSPFPDKKKKSKEKTADELFLKVIRDYYNTVPLNLAPSYSDPETPESDENSDRFDKNV